MKIGIIGVGNIGGTIAQRLAVLGHDVRVANSKGVEGVRGEAERLGATPADIRGAIEGADVVVLSIPFGALASLPPGLFDGLPDRVPVIDTSNYYPPMLSPFIPEIDGGMVESEWVSDKLGRRVIKAFNNIMAHSLKESSHLAGSSGRLAIAVAGDNSEAKATAMQLVDALGFDPVDGGTLAESWRQEPFTPSYCCDYGADEMRMGLARAVRGQARKKLTAVPEAFAKLGPNPTHDDIIRMNRGM